MRTIWIMGLAIAVALVSSASVTIQFNTTAPALGQAAVTTAWIAIPAPSRKGCVFSGWMVEGSNVSVGARYSVVANERHPVVAGTPCGAGYSRCSFKELTNPGDAVRLIAHWQPL